MKRLRQELATTSSCSEASRTPREDPLRRALVLVATLFLAGALTSGCSGGNGKALSAGNWFGSDSSAARKPAKILYAKTDGLQVRADHDGSSKSLGRLKAGEKVLRTKTSGAWSSVEARAGQLKGWVPSSQLGSRPVPAATVGQPGAAAAASEPETPETAAETVQAAEIEADAASAAGNEEAADDENEDATQPVEAAAEPATPPVPLPAEANPRPSKKGQVAPSVFDPY